MPKSDANEVWLKSAARAGVSVRHACDRTCRRVIDVAARTAMADGFSPRTVGAYACPAVPCPGDSCSWVVCAHVTEPHLLRSARREDHGAD